MYVYVLVHICDICIEYNAPQIHVQLVRACAENLQNLRLQSQDILRLIRIPGFENVRLTSQPFDVGNFWFIWLTKNKQLQSILTEYSRILSQINRLR